MNITTSAGMVGTHADLLPGHADDTVGRHSPIDPVITTAVAGVTRGCCGHDDCLSGGEPLCGGRHVNALVGTFGVVIVDPLVKGLLGCFEVGECLSVTEEFGT